MSEAISRPESKWLDRLNPLVVKEIRQALKGRMFHVWFFLILAGSTIIALFGAGQAEIDLDPRLGLEYFAIYIACLSVASIALVPVSAYFGLGQEIEDGSMELLLITGMPPGQVVRGKIVSTLSQILVHFSVMVPFVAFSYLLRGIDIVSITFCLGLTFLAAVLSTVLCVVSATLVKGRMARFLVGSALGIALIIAAIGAGSAAYGFVQFQVVPSMIDGLSDPIGRVAWSMSIFLYLSVIAIAYVVAKTRLDFAAANRSTPIRKVLLAVWLGFSLHFVWMYVVIDNDRSMFLGYSLMVAPALYFASIYLIGESDDLSVRVKNDYAKSARARFMAPFIMLPGGTRGILFIQALTLGSILFAIALPEIFGDSETRLSNSAALYSSVQQHRAAIVLLCHVLIYATLPWILLRALRPSASTRAYQFLSLGLFILGNLIPVFARLFIDNRQRMLSDDVYLSSPLIMLFRSLDRNADVLETAAPVFVVAAILVGCTVVGAWKILKPTERIN